MGPWNVGCTSSGSYRAARGVTSGMRVRADCDTVPVAECCCQRIAGGVNRFRLLSLILLLVSPLPACTLVQSFFALLGPPESAVANQPMREPALARLMPTVRPMLDRLLAPAQHDLTEAHATVDAVNARYKRRLAV